MIKTNSSKMVSLNLGHTIIERNGNKVYFIAEIGQNHQGSMEIAKRMIIQAKISGCDCVKFQKSCLKAKFTESALCRKYDNLNSWGKTYGEHKSHLEFTMEQYKDLQSFCSEIGIDFTASAMDEISLEQLDALNVPFIKIGSGDANNFPLLEKAALLKRPLIISTGMQSTKTIEHIIHIMRRANKSDFVLMHCVSSYPTKPKDCQLSTIRWLRQKCTTLVIGYSGHELGIDISKAAVLLGARVIERHFTLDKEQKGSDHRCSLEPNEMTKLVSDVKNLLKPYHNYSNEEVIKMLKGSEDVQEAIKNDTEERVLMSCEINCLRKLGKSIVALNTLKIGEKITSENVCIKVCEPNGISAENFYDVIDKKLISNVEVDHPILWEHLCVKK